MNGAANTVVEGAAVNTLVGITANSVGSYGQTVTYSLGADSSGGGFKIDPTTGVVSVADSSKINFETAAGHAYTITVNSSDGYVSSSQNFTIAVTDVAPTTPVDSNAAANAVAEGAATNTTVGVTASSTDINGPAVTYSLTGDTSGGGFKIDPVTGVVTVADATKIDYESAPGHSYTVTATASDGTLTSSQTFTIAVHDVPLSTPVDTNAAANAVVEGGAVGTAVGITASAVDPNGPVTHYSLIGDTSGGGFSINTNTGVVTVADPTKIDYESAPGHAYSITVKADDGLQTTSQSFTIGVTDAAPSTPVDSNAAANTVVEGAANGTAAGITASATDLNGPAVTYSLTGDTSGGGFTINAATGVITIADHTKIDYETAAGHAYTVTATASDGTLSSSQTFTIAVTDVAPTTPVDSNAAANTVAEGAAAGSTVGITASSTDVNGPAVTYSLTGDTSGGGFTINAATGVVTVADPSKIDYESAAGHAYTITAQASDGTLTSSQVFTIGVTDVAPSTPVDADATANSVIEGAANGSTVGVTASSTDVNGPAVTYSLTGDTSGGGFTINAATGVVTVADSTKIDFESSGAGHSYTVTAQASDGTLTSSQTFTIAVGDAPPSIPVDSNAAANTVVEGASNGSTVGVTASSTDVNGPAVTYSLTGDTSGGGFTINAATGVVTVADSTKIDYESAPGHAYTVTAQASDGTLASSQTFTIGVTDVAPSPPVDSNAGPNSVAEGAAAGSTVGVTVSSTDVNGPAVTYSLTGDTSGGGFTINAATGVVTVADPTKIDYESAAGHAYTITAQASDGTLTSSQTFTIAVSDVAPSTPVDADATANSVIEGAANGSTVGVTASSTDVNGPAVTYSLTGDTSGGGFTINATTGVVTVADSTKIDFESSGAGHSYTVTTQASDGTLTNSQTFTIAVTDAPPSTPVDSDGTINQVSQNAPNGTYTGLTASSTDVNGPAVTYSLVGDTSGGGFTINAATGAVTVADSTKIPFNAGHPSFDVIVQSSDGTDTSQQTFTINVIQNTPPVANDDSVAATEAGGANNAVPGSNPSGNVILGTGAAGDVQDTDAQDPSSALTVVAVHTGPEGGSTGTGTVGQDLVGSHGTLHLNSDGSYTYLVNQTDAQVQALHTSAETITDQFNYTIQDTGGLQDTATLTVTIHGADDLPVAVADTGTMTEDDAPTSFNVIANDSQDPDHTATNAITVGPGSITVTGPAGETFANTDATASIVSNQVQLTLNNAHFQQLRAGEHATVTVPYTLTGDTGETSSANLVVTVNGVNDVPVAVDDSGTMTEDQSGHAFTVLTNDTLDPDHTAPNNVTVNAATAVTNLSAPSGEGITAADVSVSVNGSNQVVVNLGANFQHMHDGESTTFDVAYTLNGDQVGDTSTAELHVTVTGVNDAPVVGNFTFNLANSATGNTDLVVNDPTDGAPTTTGPNKTITASLLSGASDVDGPGPLIVVAGNIATAHGGSVTMQSDGDFIYKPPVGYLGSDSFTYQVSDQNAGASGVGLGTGTVTINVTSPHVWYVNADAATDGDGSSEHPFNTLVHFTNSGVGNNVDSADDTIFLETSTAHYTGGLTLENNEQLISQSAGLTVPDGGGGAGTVTLVSASGANAVVDGGIILGSGNNIQGVDFGSSSTFALSGANVGTSTIDNIKQGVINNTGTGGAVSITGSGNALTYDFGSVTSSGGTNGIVINGASGTFHAHGGAISNASGSDVSLSSGTLNFTDDGTISDNSGSNVSVSSMTGGTQSFTGAISGSGSTGISLSTNTGATIDFSGGMALSTGASNAFTATGGGTVNVTGTNHLTTTTGTALNIANTTIGASGVTFHDISSNGATNGIVLNNTGSGSFTVTGDGSASSNHSGGQIVGSTGVGVSLTSTGPASLNYLDITNSGTDGVNASGVNGFTLTRSNVTDAAGGAADEGLQLANMLGTITLTNDLVSGSPHQNLFLQNNNTNLTAFNITNSTFQNTLAGTGGDGVLIEAQGTSVINAITIKGSTFSGNQSTGLQVQTEDTANIQNLTVGLAGAGNGNTFSGNNAGVDFDVSQNSDLTFNLINNSFQNNHSQAINVFSATASGVGASVTGKIQDNVVGTQGTLDSGSAIGSGIRVIVKGGTHGEFTIDGNQIHEVANARGIDLEGFHTTGGGGGADFNVINNTVFQPTGTNQALGGPANQPVPLASIWISSDNETGATGDELVRAVVSGNTVYDPIIWQPSFGGEGAIFLQGNNFGGINAHLQIEGTGSVLSTVATNNTISNDNNGNNNDNITIDGNVALIAPGASGPFPLLAASGGVQASTPTPGEMNLSQSELDSVVAAAIAQWAAAGASATQLAALHATTFNVGDLAAGIVGAESAPAHITIDVNADGHGWFVDPTPSDNSEFSHAAASTDLFTDPTNAAAGHLDLLTTVTHELGHVLGLDDNTSASAAHDLMYINLVDGERRLPDAADVAQANSTLTSFSAVDPTAPPPPAPATTSAPTTGQTFDAGQGGHTLVATAGPDSFVFANADYHAPAPPPITPIENYSFAQGDKFDFSAISSQFHGSGFGDALVVDAGGKFATPPIDPVEPHWLPGQPNWVNFAQFDGAHAGDAVNVPIDGGAFHLAQLQFGLLA